MVWAETAAMAIAKTVAKMVPFMIAEGSVEGYFFFARNRRYGDRKEEGEREESWGDLK